MKSVGVIIIDGFGIDLNPKAREKTRQKILNTLQKRCSCNSAIEKWFAKQVSKGELT